MIVADVSALFQVLDRGGAAQRIEARLFARAEPICVPHLVDTEIVSVLRKHTLLNRIGEARAHEALQDYLDWPLTRFPHAPLMPRAFALRGTMTAYDAFYVAPAESLGACLITCDRRLARAAQATVAVEAF